MLFKKENTHRFGVGMMPLIAVAVVSVSVCACESVTDLDVDNPNAASRDELYHDGAGVVELIGTAFAKTFEGQYWAHPAHALSVAAEEGTVSWGGFGARQLSDEPREPWPNQPWIAYRAFLEEPWSDNYDALSAVQDGLRVIERDSSGTVCTNIDCDVARAFGKFVQGVAHGFLALFYDSAFVSDETIDLENDVVELLPYPDVMEAALGYFDDAIELASGASWTLEETWINGNPYTPAEFIRLVNSYYVRYLTQLPRTPAERTTLAGLGTWGEVARRVDAGISNDVLVDGDEADVWWHAMMWYGAQTWSSTWTRADYKSIGWTELEAGSGNCGATADIDCYAEWLAAPVEERDEFLLNVPDRRIMPAGEPEGAGLDFQYHGPSQFPSSRGKYYYSFYLHRRYEEYAESSGATPFPIMVWEAQQLMKAEALLRTGGSRQVVVDIINSTRVNRGNLPPATTSETDASLMDKLIYEYRIENFFVCPGCAYFTRRGWGPLAPTGPEHHHGLVEGTPLHFPIPATELEIMRRPFYTFGGVGSEGSSLDRSVLSQSGMAQRTTIPASALYAFHGCETIGEKLAYLRTSKERPQRGAINLTRH